MAMLRSKLRARDIVTRKSIENAVTVVYALGGSTNAVLHLLAIAYEAGVAFSIHDFGDVGARVPLIGNLSPHGKYGGKERDEKTVDSMKVIVPS